MSADLVVLVPVLRRPHRVAPLVETFEATTPGARLLFIADPDDFEQQRAVHDTDADMALIPGSYAVKINAGARMTTEPLILLAADDLVPHPGWLAPAVAAIDAGAHVVGLNDLRPRPVELATHFLMTREYAEQPTIDGGRGPMCEMYVHNFPDRELIETATRRGVYAYAPAAVVEHHHHLDGKAPHDETYRRGQESFVRDRRTFRRRQRMWA